MVTVHEDKTWTNACVTEHRRLFGADHEQPRVSNSVLSENLRGKIENSQRTRRTRIAD